MDGDVEAYKKHASKEIIKMMPDDPKEIESGIEMQQSIFPTKIDIVDSKNRG